MAAGEKKVKLKLKKKGEEAAKVAPPTATAVPKGAPPKITLKGMKIKIEEVSLARRK